RRAAGFERPGAAAALHARKVESPQQQVREGAAVLLSPAPIERSVGLQQGADPLLSLVARRWGTAPAAAAAGIRRSAPALVQRGGHAVLRVHRVPRGDPRA